MMGWQEDMARSTAGPGAFYGTPAKLTVTKVSGPMNLTIPPQWGCIALDPDTMDLDRLGKARSTRGRVVRAFFWLLKAWPT